MIVRGVGCDVARVDRIQRLVESRFRTRFLQKAFYEEEVRDCTSNNDNDNDNGALSFERLAARWAAKEAAYKAMRMETFSPRFHELWVRKQPLSRAPELVLLGDTKLAWEREIGEGNKSKFHLSLSHDSGYCFAVVIVSTIL